MPTIYDTINKGVFDFAAKATGNSSVPSSLAPNPLGLPSSFNPNINPYMVNVPSVPQEVQPSAVASPTSIITSKPADKYLNATEQFLANMKLSQEAHKNDAANQQAAKAQADAAAKAQADTIASQNNIANGINANTDALKEAVIGLAPGEYSESQIKRAEGASGTTTIPYSTPSTGDPNIDAINKVMDRVNNDLDVAWDNYQTAISGPIPLSESQQMIIESVAQEYADTRNEIREANKNLQQGANIANIVSGRNRYAPEIAAGNIQKVVNEGLKQVGEINSKMASVIAQLKEGYETKNYNRLNQAWKDYSQYQKDKTAALEKQKEQIITAKKDIIEQNKSMVQASRDAAISDLISQGITDPYQLINYINYDEQGNQVGDITMDEITKVLKAKQEEKRNTQVIESNGHKMLIDSDTGETIKDLGESKNTQIIELNGHKVLVNSLTGQTIQDLGSSSGTSDEQKRIEEFNKDLSSWDKVGTREQAIRQLQARYPDIDPQSIQDWFYYTYPEGYNAT